MRLLGEDLAGRGFAVEGPLLAGHGATTAALARTTWHDWYRSAEEALDRLRQRVGARPVAVVGLSMGGLLALELARQHRRELGAVAALAAPLWLPPWADRFARLSARLPLWRALALPKLSGSDLFDPALRRRNEAAQGRARMPLSALASLVALGDHLRHTLGDMTVPVFLAHSERDHTVPFACMDAIAHRIGTLEYAKLVLHQSFHVITLDVERALLFERVADWIERHI